MQKEIRDGLILRSISEGVISDRENLSQFYVDVFVEEEGEPERVLGPWTEDLLTTHPYMSHDDIWVVVDPTQADRIVSALLLIPQVWRYDDIELSVGRVELVATHKDYRRRGLIRELMQVAHERSVESGQNIQVITGIPNYYRQFGYAMALDLSSSAFLPFFSVPKRKEDEQPNYTLRAATEEDMPLLMELYDDYARQCLWSAVRTEAYWHFALFTRQPKTPPSLNFRMIVNQTGEAVGYVALEDIIWGGRMGCWEYVVGEKSSYLDTYLDVMRGMIDYALETNPEHEKPNFISFDNGIHPAVQKMVSRTQIGWKRNYAYAWYVRAADLAQLMRDIAPALELRLEGSAAHRFSGELGIDFYDKTGLYTQWEEGKLTKVENQLPEDYQPDAAFPFGYFMSLVFGHRTIEELRPNLPDLMTTRKSVILLDIMFPKKHSWVIGAF